MMIRDATRIQAPMITVSIMMITVPVMLIVQRIRIDNTRVATVVNGLTAVQKGMISNVVVISGIASSK